MITIQTLAHEDCARIALKHRARLKRLEKQRRARGDEHGARRASVGATVAAAIAQQIRQLSEY